MISEKQLAEWELLASEAAPGPWCYAYRKRPDGMYSGQIYNDAQGICTMHWVSKEVEPRHLRCIREESGLFIAAAREAVPQLIALVRDLQKTLHAVSDTSNKLLEHNNCLEKEADWLAKYLAKTKIFHPADSAMDCPKLEGPAPEISCITCWREAARKATKEN